MFVFAGVCGADFMRCLRGRIIKYSPINAMKSAAISEI